MERRWWFGGSSSSSSNRSNYRRAPSLLLQYQAPRAAVGSLIRVVRSGSVGSGCWCGGGRYPLPWVWGIICSKGGSSSDSSSLS